MRICQRELYLYVNAPVGAENVKFQNAEEAYLYLIENYGISTVPWDDNGLFKIWSCI